MMKEYYSIAGLTVEMDCSGRTEKQARPYIVNKLNSVDFCLKATPEYVKDKYPDLNDDDLEYISTGANFYWRLLTYNGFMLHASAVAVDNKAYLFSANSGTGKSTHTGLWLDIFHEHAYILNDDKPAVRLIDNVWYAFGTPWSGKNDMSVNTGVPIAGICVLERGNVNEIEPLFGKEAVTNIYTQTNRPRGAQSRIILLELLDNLITHVPIWKLKCNMDPEAAIVAYEAMSGQKYEGDWK